MPPYSFRLEKSSGFCHTGAFQLALASLAATTGVKSAAYSMGRWRFTESLSHAAPRFTFDADSFSIFVDCLPARARPVLKSSYCLEQQLHTLFAACTSEEYSLQYPGRKSAWRGAVPWEVRCGAIRNRMHRKPVNWMQETFKRISRRSPLRRLGRI